ncbi:hypothetical protein OBBRIDRAFT_521001 [Obba rivulosa]|uniref:Uncharacterized protein n=1 Tax=Obba rivulosa TaxID=1052685 RepID=A0A8E2DKH2_9APHY|nr:hypothetical protein OBBRIDRAFT_521001 [Obba rivulosa]
MSGRKPSTSANASWSAQALCPSSGRRLSSRTRPRRNATSIRLGKLLRDTSRACILEELGLQCQLDHSPQHLSASEPLRRGSTALQIEARTTTCRRTASSDDSCLGRDDSDSTDILSSPRSTGAFKAQTIRTTGKASSSRNIPSEHGLMSSSKERWVASAIRTSA